MSGEFKGKTVLVTGAAGNLGQAVSRRFADGGAQLVLVDRSAERLAELAKALGVKSLQANVDLSDADAVDKLIAEAEAKFGGIDVLAHTVGGYDSGKTVADADREIMEKMFALNVWPVYITGGAVAKHMLKRGQGGKIVFVLARASLKGSAKHSAYTASKAAAQRIMESLSMEVRDKGIHVNGVMPSTIDTPPNRKSMPDADVSKWVTPEQVADTIAFLASDAASALHGVSLEVYNRA
ncbi:MAG: SDR family NAD(P)-dependent oxidoreductase [Pleurocapsa minor GSE-CHR-MK-17-07R]|jgi:NAD(P)-dependent dehydrogenase (short-subunit alcohol dehydrogenase family)|nr:SDR family NAD(P)-dependent oxidoreductase [Pleurocapsa minor GSE-CHR-MK 17-07R]